jgi:hypothetical protein
VRDFRVFFPSDGTTTFGMGGASAAELQKATLATLGFLFAQVLTIDEIIRRSVVVLVARTPRSFTTAETRIVPGDAVFRQWRAPLPQPGAACAGDHGRERD